MHKLVHGKSPAIPKCQYIYFLKRMAIPYKQRTIISNGQHAVMANSQACGDWTLAIQADAN